MVGGAPCDPKKGMSQHAEMTLFPCLNREALALVLYLRAALSERYTDGHRGTWVGYQWVAIASIAAAAA
ncbi:hypothetical protein HPP92_006851 [Vanilla planifolia]|uniref:Uncharacterized protein n=1 Tax=Vanilla planifolia TaxID=51239 RepID=A0A835RGE4_VANPL|nr:hypothetical protein HPP92_007082 [Vanilla planifolia]KAG0489988.1 hypothetical protein HPP92_006851 [Vanilla planifolia]